MSIDSESSAGKNRVPKGIPRGGQFATTAHAEPTLSLALDTAAQDYWERRLDEPTPSLAAERLSELVDVEDFVDIAYISAAHWQRRYNQADKSVIVDRDDIARETILCTLEALCNGSSLDAPPVGVE